MNLYNVEIFRPDYTYRSSFQMTDVSYEYDYLSLSSNKIKLLKIQAERGDYIRISKGEQRICGIIEGVTDSVTSTTIEYKNIMSVFDVNVYADISAVTGSENAIEDWLEQIITQTYISNSDTLQNIKGMEVKTTSKTTGIKRLGLDGNINNLYDIIKNALIKHDVTVISDIDVQLHKIVVSIGQNENEEKYIEADLPNVLEREFNVKKSEESINKLVVINEESENEQAIYYLMQDGTVSTDTSNDKRIYPVIFDVKTITVSSDETFEDASYQEALEALMPEEYDNLIELTVEPDDCLVKPELIQIGQKVAIQHDGMVYHTILTGIERKQRVKLIFGAVRTELTKKLKRRIK